jgi:4-azaleucine resistance transporter AzlC
MLDTTAVETNAPAERTTRRRELLLGVRDEAPILLGVAPFGVIYGALAMAAHLPAAAAQAMSSIIFAGSAQFVAAQLFGAGASGIVIVLVVFVVNLRHALYSASVAPHVKHLGPAWKGLLAYLLTDEAYAVVITHYNQPDDASRKHWYFLGAGLTLWTSWQICTAIGILLGARIPSDWPLGFMLPLTFIALVVPSLRKRSMIAAALAAGLTGYLTMSFPLKTGLLAAAAVGIATGMLLERWDR